MEKLKIDDIGPSEDTVMTAHLIRLFRSAGCSPACHACCNEIVSGDIFKLVPHPNTHPSGNISEGLVDEMCCANCGTHQLNLRDRRWRREHKNHRARKIAAGGHGYSRPSKAQ